MTPFIVYLTNGKILRSGTCQKETFDLQAGEGEFVLALSADPNTNYVVDGEVVPMPEKPGEFFEFDYDQKQWVFNSDLATARVKFVRDQLLKEGPDRINPLWWGSMTAEQQQSWSTYRQDLLDITQQPGFPADVTWPVKPE